jgi:uncharacterized membrane protein
MSIDTPPPAAPASEDRTVAILTYLTLIGFIVAIVIHSSKKTTLGAFHLRQGLGLLVSGIALGIGGFVLAFIPFVGWIALMAAWVGFLVLWLMGLIAAVNGQQKPMPVLGEHYQKWFSGAFV